jgi:hypothetical protein
VTEDGFLADRNLDYSTGAWDFGSLVDLQLRVASHSNLACSAGPKHYICFEDLNGNLCLKCCRAHGSRERFEHITRDSFGDNRLAEQHGTNGLGFYLQSPSNWLPG